MLIPQKYIFKGRKQTFEVTLPSKIAKDITNYIQNLKTTGEIEPDSDFTPQDVIITLVNGFVEEQDTKDLDARIKKMKEDKAAKAKADKEMRIAKKKAKLEAELEKLNKM